MPPLWGALSECRVMVVKSVGSTGNAEPTFSTLLSRRSDPAGKPGPAAGSAASVVLFVYTRCVYVVEMLAMLDGGWLRYEGMRSLKNEEYW